MLTYSQNFLLSILKTFTEPQNKTNVWHLQHLVLSIHNVLSCILIWLYVQFTRTYSSNDIQISFHWGDAAVKSWISRKLKEILKNWKRQSKGNVLKHQSAFLTQNTSIVIYNFHFRTRRFVNKLHGFAIFFKMIFVFLAIR